MGLLHSVGGDKIGGGWKGDASGGFDQLLWFLRAVLIPEAASCVSTLSTCRLRCRLPGKERLCCSGRVAA